MNRAGIAAFLLALAAPLAADDVELLSRIPPRLAAETANGASRPTALSADGRFLVFLSSAPNLVAGVTDANRGGDVFLYDRATRETVLVSRSAEAADATADQASQNAVISADGRFVAFTSAASDFVDGPDEDVYRDNVFLWDRVSGETELVSHVPGAPGREGNGSSFQPSISRDGRFVAFASNATDLVDGVEDVTPFAPEIFLYDRRTGQVTLLTRSASSPGRTANGFSFDPTISADGRFVAFRSRGTDLVPGQKDRGNTDDIFLWDRTTGRTTLVSHAAADPTQTADAPSQGAPFLSADGSFLAFVSRARNLVPGQSGSGHNVFLWARATGASTLVTHAPASFTQAAAGSSSSLEGMSADGNWLLFTSDGRSLVRGQRDSFTFDVFLWSRQTGQIRLVSGAQGSATRTANAHSFASGLSADGAWVLLTSLATDLVAGGRGPGLYQDVFLWSRSTGRASLVSHAAGSPRTAAGGNSDSALISADGRFLAYASFAPDLDAETRDTNGDRDVVLESRSGDREIVTRHPPGLASATPLGGSQVTSIDASGRWVTFLSGAPELLPGQIDTNSGEDAFLHDRATRKTTLVSHAAGSPRRTGNARCSNAQISADGRFVALICQAGDLVPGQTSDNAVDASQVFLWNRETGVTTLISHAAGAPTKESNGEAGEVWINADGSVLVFSSGATDLVPGQIDGPLDSDVFVWERATGTVSLLSGKAGSPTETGDSSSFNPRMSADGRIIVFGSFASDLVTDVTDSNERTDVFVHDRTTGTTTLISRAADASGAVGGELPRVSADGRVVAFTSSFLTVPGQTGPSSSNLFLWDRQTGTIRLVPLAPPAVGGAVPVWVDLDAAGRFVTFASFSSEEGDTGYDVFLFDRESGATVLVSRAAGSPGRTANGDSDAPRISADGRIVVFVSTATDLAGDPADPPLRGRNLFVYDRIAGTVSLVTHSFRSPSLQGEGDIVFHVLAASGSAVAFTSVATDLVPRDFNRLMDAFAASLP